MADLRAPTRGEPSSRGRSRTGDQDRTDDQKLLMPQPYADTTFLESDAWRALRIMGEFIEGFDALARLGPAVSIFGSARTSRGDRSYRQARRLGRRLAEEGFTVITGGGGGIMEAANRGAREAEGVSVGLAIDLPHEQHVNEYVDLAVYHRYFFVRKTMFVKYAQAFVDLPRRLRDARRAVRVADPRPDRQDRPLPDPPGRQQLLGGPARLVARARRG